MKIHPSHLFALLTLLLGAASSTVQAAASGAITWYRLPPGCGEGDPEVLQCGSRGGYTFGKLPEHLDPESCAPPVSSTEIPRLYPGSSLGPVAGLPCGDGSCLSPIPATGPWVATIDWQDAHGLTVAETVKRVANLPIHLFPLDALEASAILGDRVGDAHVLFQLCRVAEAMEINPPQAVNLSFGRYHSPVGPGGASLETEIRELVEELSPTTRFVAAAGNDGLLLFPADIPEVLAVGALDLAAWRRDIVAPSHISPPADAYFPAYGLLLESGKNDVWPAPPGSSYAAAIATGWVASFLLDHPEYLWTILGTSPGRPLHPQLPPLSEGPIELAIAGVALADSANEAADRLLDIAVGSAAEAWAKLDEDDGPDLNQPVAGTPASIPSLTWTEVRGQANSPAPDTYPCVPCADAPDPWAGGGGGLDLNKLVVTLGGPRDFGAGISLKAFYLQADQVYFRLPLSEDPTFLQALLDGQIHRLHVENIPGNDRNLELLLVWVLQQGPAGPRFVHKTPVSRVSWEQSATE